MNRKFTIRFEEVCDVQEIGSIWLDSNRFLDIGCNHVVLLSSAGANQEARRKSSSSGGEESFGSIREEGPSGCDRSELRDQGTA
jgi:hypothetical protein